MSHSNNHHSSLHQSNRRHPRNENDAGKGIQNYGVWKATPTDFSAQTLNPQERSPHIYLHFDDRSGQSREAAINVASTDSDNRLVYWLYRNKIHPITSSLASLDYGFTRTQSHDGQGTDLSLDFLRTKPQLLDFSAGLIVQDSDPNASNNILSKLEPILNDAIDAKADVYIFGSSYNTGIHDIHMNQGSNPTYENSVGTDGALIFHYPDDDHYDAVFLAFASQAIPTDDVTGAADDDSIPLSVIAQDDD